MKFRVFVLALFVCLIAAFAAAQQISGDYIETRTADIYTGACFANGEVGLVGNEAILGWNVKHGSWNGVALDGLSVVGVVRARATLGDPYGKPYPAKSVLIVDDQASLEQRAALESFAHQMGGELLANTEQVIAAPVDFQVLHDSQHHGKAFLRAGQFAVVQTRGINDTDHLCGNESTFYPPLTQLAHAMPAVALTDQYKGPDLGVTWENHGKRSAFVGSFAR